jgi:hypothetical protein
MPPSSLGPMRQYTQPNAMPTLQYAYPSSDSNNDFCPNSMNYFQPSTQNQSLLQDVTRFDYTEDHSTCPVTVLDGSTFPSSPDAISRHDSAVYSLSSNESTDQYFHDTLLHDLVPAQNLDFSDYMSPQDWEDVIKSLDADPMLSTLSDFPTPEQCSLPDHDPSSLIQLNQTGLEGNQDHSTLPTPPASEADDKSVTVRAVGRGKPTRCSACVVSQTACNLASSNDVGSLHDPASPKCERCRRLNIPCHWPGSVGYINDPARISQRSIEKQVRQDRPRGLRPKPSSRLSSGHRGRPEARPSPHIFSGYRGSSKACSVCITTGRVCNTRFTTCAACRKTKMSCHRPGSPAYAEDLALAEGWKATQERAKAIFSDAET